MVNFKANIFVFVSLLTFLSPAIAGHLSNLYDVEILVSDESAGTRWGAFKRGLDEVFIRISGDSIVMDKLKRPAPTAYIKQYSYIPVEDPTTNEQGELLSHRIKIQYNAGAMEKYLLDNGFPVWGEHRPAVVIWLAVRDGRNEYVLKKNDRSLIKTAADNALIRRGIPERWPVYDSKDKQILSVADIRGGFKDPVTSASKRYSRGPALAGSLIWNGREWQSSWSLLMKSENRHWSLVDTDYDRLINKAIDQAADALGVVFALRGVVKNKDFATVQLGIQAVDSIEKYNRIENYLEGLPAVDSARTLHVEGSSVVFEVVLRGDEADFLNAIKNDDEFIKVEKTERLQDETEPLKATGQPSAAPEEDDTAGARLSANQHDSAPRYYYKLTH